MSKLVSNYLFTVIYQLLLMVTPFITTPYVARVLRPEGVGIDAYVLSVVQLFLVFSILSIPLYGSRQIAIKAEKKERSKEFWSIYSLQVIISLITCASYLIFINTVSEYRSLYLMHIISLISTAIDISWYFIGKEEIKSITTRNIIVKLLGIALIFLFVNDYKDLNIYILINIMTLFLGQLIMWLPLLKEVTFEKFEMKDLKSHMMPIVVLFIPQLLIQLYVLVNKVLLGNISGEVEVGYYNQANKIIKLALGIITSLGTILLPRMSLEFSRGNVEIIKKYTNYTTQFVLMVTLPMVFGLIALAPNFVKWFLGAGYSKVALLIMVMSPTILFVGLANIFGIQILIATNQQKKYSIAITIGSVLSLLVNILLVSSLSSMGTTLSLVVAEAAGAIVCMVYAKNYINIKKFFHMFLKYTVLSIVMLSGVFILTYLVHSNPFLLTFLQLAVGIIIYGGCLILIKDPMVLKIFNIIKNKKK